MPKKQPTSPSPPLKSPSPQSPLATSENPSSSPNAQNNNQEDKPRLTEHEKKANHIASEQKRRQAIRDGFDRLTELVPGLEGQGRSESVVLKRTVEFMREQLEEKGRLEGVLGGLEGREEREVGGRNGNGHAVGGGRVKREG